MSNRLKMLLTVAVNLLRDIAEVLKFGFRYPPLILLFTFVALLVNGRALSDLDGPHVLWDENPWHGISAGFAAAAMFALFFHFFDVLHARDEAANANKPSPAFRLFALLILLCAILPQFAMSGFTATGWTARIWFPIGLVIPLAVIALLRERTVPTASVMSVKPDKKIGWFRWIWTETSQMYRSRLFATSMALIFVLFLLLYHVVRESWWQGRAIFGSAFIVLLAIYFLFGGLAWVYYIAKRSGHKNAFNYFVGFGLVALYIISVGMQNIKPYTYFEVEHEVPEITRADGTSYYASPVPWRNEEFEKLKPAAHQYEDFDALKNWKKRMDAYFVTDSETHINLVTVSGGASTSALYVAEILYGLEIRHPGFIDKTRIISGASGGMLGAAYFVSRLHPPSNPKTDPIIKLREDYLKAVGDFRTGKIELEQFVKGEEAYKQGLTDRKEDFMKPLKADFLSPLIQAWFAKDVPEAFLAPLDTMLGSFRRGPARIQTHQDRGTALEDAWVRHMPSLNVPFKSLAEAEWKGELPSLVFTPMTVEDGRQVIISNLILDYMMKSNTPKAPESLATYTAVEFYRLFPEAGSFRLSTALRLQASFPFFCPPAYLPTNPTRRVVDAGYYDNYGLIVACRWLEKHKEYLAEKHITPHVYHIWSYGYGRNGSNLETREEAAERLEHGDREVNIHAGFTTFSGPLGGLMSAWRANMAYRGEERLNEIMGYFQKQNPNARLPASRYKMDMLDHMDAKSKETGVPMNWYLGPHSIELVSNCAGSALNALPKDEVANLQAADAKDKNAIEASRKKVQTDRKAAGFGKMNAAGALFDLDIESQLMKDPTLIPKGIDLKPKLDNARDK